ncbi:unnamed protein product [Trifolium pratense]|uniref:Uncharacterized protein n=1 Tax=Trifolium pratense TaxID=57577 RepID=A0ACB0IV44_TRIPR|nr:unnamed protein product [Trifolium pratense]
MQKIMTRKTVKLGFICDDSARKATYKKRKKGIMKKVSELTILCGIPACAIISNPFDSKTEVWPDIAEAKQIIERYQNSSVIDGAKIVNQESFLLQRITKAREQLRKQKHDNHEKELTVRMIGYMKNKQLPDDLSVSDLKQFDKLIDKNLKDLDNKIVELNSFD